MVALLVLEMLVLNQALFSDGLKTFCVGWHLDVAALANQRHRNVNVS